MLPQPAQRVAELVEETEPHYRTDAIVLAAPPVSAEATRACKDSISVCGSIQGRPPGGMQLITRRRARSAGRTPAEPNRIYPAFQTDAAAARFARRARPARRDASGNIAAHLPRHNPNAARCRIPAKRARAAARRHRGYAALRPREPGRA